ncbi:MAG: YceI family protein [Gammaproteobacteria bacterium]|nr:YceI family protein [Pseudomonadales bacterium]MCP5347056.1 YceI family protein [Pseudomonadales bacterium]
MRKLSHYLMLASTLLFVTAPTQAAMWELDPGQSLVYFKYSYGGEPFQGEFRNVQATFDIDPMRPSSCEFQVTIPIEDVYVDSPEVKDYLLDYELFDVDTWPTASFTAENCSVQSADTFVADGTLTIRDQTHPLSFPFNLTMETCDGQVCFHMTSEVTIQRLEYGVGQGYWANTAEVPNEVAIEVDVYAMQK